jgi:hypothetical protein
MDLADVLRILWQRRLWVLMAAGIAIVVGLAVGFRMSLLPPSLTARSSNYGTGTTKVLIDTKPSTLTDSGRDYAPLVTRAGVYAQLVSTDPVRRLIGGYSHIPSEQIATDVPSNTQILSNQPRPNRASNPGERLAEIAAEGSHYRVDIGVDSELPIITIAAQAPDEKHAVRLANGTADGIREYIRRLKPQEPSGRTVEIRRLGNAAGNTVGGRTGLTAALAAALVLFALGCLAVVGANRIVQGWGGVANRPGSGGDQAPPGRALAPVNSPEDDSPTYDSSPDEEEEARPSRARQRTSPFGAFAQPSELPDSTPRAVSGGAPEHGE